SRRASVVLPVDSAPTKATRLGSLATVSLAIGFRDFRGSRRMARPTQDLVSTMRIDQNVIREILARTDIGSFVGSYVALQKRGKDLVGLCPFHGEKTPSLHV